ncbi:MAG: L-ribulose-5-phosphate 4-epimerase AraD [Bryobacteraceae bacterium]|nr:L-ribulose-5-phosphate 4-epimerase AraD [Bryobacteraceae bacterium]
MEALRREVVEANRELARRGLVIYTFGNASGIARDQGLVAIKPSGVEFDALRPEDIVLTDLDGKVVEGSMRPSSDLPTHLEIYKAFAEAGGVVHTHSTYATAWAQARHPIPCLGTTHADYFYGTIPVTEPLTDEEIESGYELSTGRAIVRLFVDIDPAQMPAVLVSGHGPFTWGGSAAKAAFNAVILEEVARIAQLTIGLDAKAAPLSRAQLDKHFLRKHGPGAYYGQK